MHIYLFSPIRYDSLHQRPQKLAERFLAMGAAVTYVQPTGVRDLRSEQYPVRFCLQSLWYHVLALLSAVLPFMRKKRKKEFAHRQFTVVSLPVTVPVNRFDSKVLEAMNALVLQAFLHREIVEEGTSATIAIFQNPFWGRVIEGGEFERVCYDCLDDVSLYAGHASPVRFDGYEQRLLDKSDVVVTTAAKLEARLRAKTSKPVHRIPNGVDYEWFRTCADASRRPVDLATVPRPLVGYIGSVAGWLDYELIVAVARLLPEVSFVFVGPAEHEGRVQQLCRSPNIFWLGKKPYDTVPGYVNAFDVCTIPFRRGAIAETTNPVKVFEYFALGKAVVSTPLYELHEYEEAGLVLFGDSAETFADAVRRALEEGDNERQTRRMEIAAAHSWRSHARAFMRALRLEEMAPA